MTTELSQYIVSLWYPPPPTHACRNQFLKAFCALMFPRKALARQSVFSYNSVVVKTTDHMVETVLIVENL